MDCHSEENPLGEMERNSSIIADHRCTYHNAGYPRWVVKAFTECFNGYDSGCEAPDDVKIADLKGALFEAVVLHGVDRDDAFNHFEGLVQRLIQEFLREELLSVLDNGDDPAQRERAQKARQFLDQLRVKIEK